MTAALAVWLALFGAGSGEAIGSEIEMDDIRMRVAELAAAETGAEEVARLAALRTALAAAGASFSVLRLQADGSEVNLATGEGPDPDAPVLIRAHTAAEIWTSDPITPVDIDNFYVLFRE